jgi:hypothetical protein
LIVRGTDVRRGRRNLTEIRHGIQMATIRDDVRALQWSHQHDISTTDVEGPQEAWIVVNGAIEASLYDLDGSLLRSVTLLAGDCVVTLDGGHGYRVLANDTVVYEFASGRHGGEERSDIAP